MAFPQELCRGYDSVSKCFRDTAMTGSPTLNLSGGTSSLSIEFCSGKEELARTLEIDASLSVGYMVVASATAKMQFVKKLNVSSSSLTVLIYARHITGTCSVPELAWKEDLESKPKEVSDAGKFVITYGDSVVDSVTTGGEYYGVYVFHSESQTERDSLKTELQASGVSSGVTVSADVQAKLANFSSKSRVSWKFSQDVSGLANPILPSRETFMDYAIGFSAIKPDSPVTTGFTVRRYEQFEGMSHIFAQVKINREYFLGYQNSAEGGLLRDLLKLTCVKNDISELKQIYSVYEYSGDVELDRFQEKLHKDIQAIRAQIQTYSKDPGTTELDQSLSLESLNVKPVLRFKEIPSPTWGGTGGNAFDFNVKDSLRNHVKLTSIQLNGCLTVDHLRVTYSQRHPDQETTTLQEYTKQFGGNGGNVGNTLFFNDSWISHFSDVRSSYVVFHICTTLKDGNSRAAGGTGGDNQSRGPPQSWSVPDNCFVQGFRGGCDDKLYLNRLQPVVVQLQPAALQKTIL